MKRFFSLALCFCMMIAAMPMAMAAGAAIPPVPTNAKALYDTTKGLAWLGRIDEVTKAVQEANESGREDLSLYDLARESIIIRLGERLAHVKGYDTYLDEDENVLAFEENGTVYVPLRFIAQNLNIEIEWDGITAQTTLKTSKKSVSVKIGSRNITVDGVSKTIDAAPVLKHEKTYLPITAVGEAVGKTVLYDERGTVLITSATGQEILKDEHWDAMAADDFKLEREKVVHPQPYDTHYWMQHSGRRGVFRAKNEVIKQTMEPYLQMSYLELAEHVVETVSNLKNFGYRPAFETAAMYMAMTYEEEPDEDLALRIIIMSFHSALLYDDLSKDGGNSFYNIDYVTPTYLVAAYDKIYHSPMWKVFEENYGHDAKKVLREWWTSLFEYLDANQQGVIVANYPIRFGHMGGLAVILDEPAWVRVVMERLDAAIQPHHYHADGMWYEGSFDYGNQMTGNAGAPAVILANYRDPIDYVDEEYGIFFDGRFEVQKRWTNWFDHVKGLSDIAYFPDGSRIAVNDTHWTDVAKNMADNTIKEKYIKENIELNHFGLYGLKYGDTEEAQQVNLVMQPTTGVSHQHTSYLGLSYYTAGMEVLPDQGYATPTTLHRYAKINTYDHNMSFMSAARSAAQSGSFWAKPNVYAYDNGLTNGKQIQLIEGANLMPNNYELEMNRRMLMMIAVDKNHSYLVDIHRMKGNGVSENYLKQTEDEDVEFNTNLPLEDEYDGTLKAWLPTKGASGGQLIGHSYSGVVTKPRGAVTSDDFWFTWTGKTSGTTLKTFIKGSDNMIIAFSQHPTIRRTNKDAALKNNFPGYHFYRRNNEKIGDVTTYASLYEGYKKDETGKVLNVTWIDPEDLDKMTTMVKVELENYIDYIYVSGDMEERKMEDFTMSGYANVVRTDKATGEIVYSYLYGEGAIKKSDYVVNGNEELSYRVITAQGSRPTDNSIPNELKVEGLPSQDIVGWWGNVNFPDGSGTAFRVEGVKQSIITIHNDPGFYMSEKGPVFTAYPKYVEEGTDYVAKFSAPYNTGMVQRSLKGEVNFTINRPTFVEAK